VGHLAIMGEINAYNILVWMPEGRRPFGRPSCSWDKNIKMDLRDLRLESVDWIHLI
jgi:hypothetical protein